MMKKSLLSPSALTVFCLLFVAHPSWAITLTSETGAGSATFSQTLAADGDFGLGPDKIPETPEEERALATSWGWNVGYTLSRTSLTFGASPGTTASTVVDNTHELGAGLNYTGAGAWGFDGGVSYSNTPEENLKSIGAILGASYVIPLGMVVQAIAKPPSAPAPQLEIDESEPGDDESEPFEGTLRLKLGLGTRGYEQTLGPGTPARRPGRAVPATDSKGEIRQTAVGLSARWAPHEDWTVDLNGTFYSYDKDVAAFTSRLDSPRALRFGSSASYNGDGGFPDWATTLAVGYYATENLKAMFSTSQASLAINKSMASEVRAAFELDLTSTLRGMIGLEYMSSYVSYDTLGLIGLELAL